MIELKPLRDDAHEFEQIEKQILDLLRKEIYLPLLKEINVSSKTIKNALTSLLAAIQSGQIIYSNGRFSGRFTSTLSRELRGLGARWDRKHGTWNIPPSKLSIDIKFSISLSQNKFEENLKRIYSKLIGLDHAKLAEKLDTTKLFDTTLWKTEKNFNASIKNVTIAPEVTPERRKIIAEEYTHNLKRYVEDFTRKESLQLKKEIEEAVFKGQRYEGLINKIKKSYGVSQGKAKFLARQETRLMTVKYKESRYREAGLNEYKWRCVVGSALHPVRHRHKQLDGTIQRWDNPPVTTEPGEATRRNHPGEDFNCRCTAVPVVNFKKGKK